MNQLYVFTELNLTTLQIVILSAFFIPLLLTGGSILINEISNRNISDYIIILLFLIIFMLIGCYFILIELTFIGLSYFIIYIGAISILFIFIIMILDIEKSITPMLSNNNHSTGLLIENSRITGIKLELTQPTITPFGHLITWGLLSFISFCSIISILIILWDYGLILDKTISLLGINMQESNIITTTMINDSHNILQSNHNIWLLNFNTFTQIKLLGYILYTHYSLWLLIISLILLLAMIGPIAILATTG